MKPLMLFYIILLALLVTACGSDSPGRAGTGDSFGPPAAAPSQTSTETSTQTSTEASTETSTETSTRTPSTGSSTELPATLELEATYPEGFSFLNGVRELSDGTILAADPLAEVLLHIDLDAGTADTLGRPGPGPQEYKQPDQVLPLPGDSSLLVDLGKMQLTEIGPDGVFGDGIPMAIPGDDRFPLLLHPRFVDDLGHLYDQAPRSRNGGPRDSVAIVRFDRDSRRLDTVSMLWYPEIEQIRSRGGGFLPRMLEARNAWAVGGDGRIAIVHARDFSVEWRFPDGRVIHGPSHPFPTHGLGPAEKEAVLAGMGSSGISMTALAGRDGSVSRMTMSRGIPRDGAGPSVEEFEWAETLPPFHPDRARISSGGELWVERYLPVDSLPQIVVFDERGRSSGSVTLPHRRQLIGFGRSRTGHEVAYVVRTDEFDLRWLERYRVVR